MDLPEPLHQLIEEMGASVMAAVSQDPRCRDLAAAIQKFGWDVGILVEATISLHRHEEEGPGGEHQLPRPSPSPDAPWSEADRDFLRTFRIRLD